MTQFTTSVLVCVATCWATLAIADDESVQFFETQVRPVLVGHCQECHGETKQESGLRLDSRQALLHGGDRGPSIVLGQPDDSLLIGAVRHAGELEMPPTGKLSDSQIARLEHWVRLGAPWPTAIATTGDQRAEVQRRHWAFQPVGNPPLPEVRNGDWVQTPIDQFILAKIESVGLAPSPRADRRTLIRRLTYDLTGLPPTPEQVEAFVNDSAPDAYVKLVDCLLQSPQYGVKWARHWLDVARYADTKGYVYAREERFWVHAPAYRDWVTQAFNGDLPYNHFLLLQIAADQVAPHDKVSLAAMGFLTLGRRFLGVTHDIIDDRIDVVTRGTMGLTVACARCHDHKYDPIPTADYYALHGIFLNSREQRLRIGDPIEHNAAFTAFEQEREQRQAKLDATLLAERTEAAQRARSRVTDYLVAQTELSKYPEEGFDQLLAESDVIPAFVRRWEAWLASEARSSDPVFWPWQRFAQLDPDEFQERSPEVLCELTESGLPVNPRVLLALTPPPNSWRDVAQRYGELLREVDQEWCTTCEIERIAGRPEPVSLEPPASEALRQILYGADSPCQVPDEDIVSIEGFFDTATCEALWKLQGEVDRWLIQSPLAPAEAVFLTDRSSIRPSRILRRGNPANRGPEVARHFVSVVAGLDPRPFSQGSGRLELAQAIVDRANPLTTRVWVNRVWQHHFGAGLVRTASDFGTRAEPPSHPELLDWLATRFMEDGWSTKRLHRLLLLSNTYQQSSAVPADVAGRAYQVDPENRLLWRMNVRRLTFEEFRDSLLAITGRLDCTMGGRASDLFAGDGTLNRRRTLYGLVDRQFLPATLRVFDFANPDLHIPMRSETIVPQQALFALNHPFMAEQAKALAAQAQRVSLDNGPTNLASNAAEQVRRLYRAAYQRDPAPHQLKAALAFLADDAKEGEPDSAPAAETMAWQYGYGELDRTANRLQSFQHLPYFTGSVWQGGPHWPDTELGWVQLSAEGGHPGNDLQHVAVRRWIAPHGGTFSVTSSAIHEVAAGDGIRCAIISSRHGMLASLVVHNQRQEINVASIELQPGDTLDFVVDFHADPNSDQYLWPTTIRDSSPGDSAMPNRVPSETPHQWDAQRDFSGPVPVLLDGWEQLAQILLMANELMFVD